MSDERAVAVAKAPKPVVAMTERGVALTSMDEAWRFASAIAGTDLAPSGMSANEVFGVVQAGAEVGLTPLRALANMKIINGRVGPMGSLAKALVRQANVLKKGTGFKQFFTGTEMEDDWTANITTHRADEADPVTTSFSVKDAKRARLWQKQSKRGVSPWVGYPQRMLMFRALGFHLDDNFAEVLMGFHIAEVLDDYPAEEVVHAVMEPLDEPAKDPLLDELQARADAIVDAADAQADIKTDEDLMAELEEVGATMQPPDEVEPNPATAAAEEEMGSDSFDTEDPLADVRETVESLGGTLGPTKEILNPTIGKSPSPLSSVMAEAEAKAEPPPMTEDEAMADLIREGLVEGKGDEVADADPGNAAKEGDEIEDPS